MIPHDEPPGGAPDGRPHAGMQLLYVTEDVPSRDVSHGDGSSMIPYGVILHLPDEVVVRLLTFEGEAAVPDEVAARCLQVVRLGRRPTRRAVLRSLVSRHSIGAWERRTGQAAAAVRRMSAAADVTLLHGPHATQLAHAATGPLVVQVVDPWSARVDMEARLARGPRAAYRRAKAAGALSLERSLPGRARLLTVGSKDAAAWSSVLNRPVRAVPNGVDVASTSPGRREDPSPTVCFVGSLGYGPNILSARRLVEDVAPAVWRRRPEVRFLLAGRQPDPTVLSLAGEQVRVLANVPSVAGVFAQSDVACFPDRQGLGIRNSVTEALAAGVPVVATPAAAREQPEHPLLHVATATDELVGLVLALLEQPRPSGTRPAAISAMRSWRDAAADYVDECTRAVWAAPGAT